jgi:hypothetical protein
MAKPRYILCSKELLVDQLTGLASHINVIDRFEIRIVRPPELPPGTAVAIPNLPIAQMLVTAAWAKETGDTERDVFEYETVLHKPDGTSDVVHKGEFQFLSKRFYRIDTGIMFTTQTKFSTSGELSFESRIRKRGMEEWTSQSFALDIELVSPEPAVESTVGDANQSAS